MTIISMLCGMMQKAFSSDGPHTSRRITSAIDTMQQASSRMNVLLEDLLDTSKIEAGRYTINPQPLDVAQLAENFLAVAARKLGAPAKRFATPALEAMRAHDWPGNVRELENVCWRLAALAPGETISVHDLQGALSRSVATASRSREWDQLLAAWAQTRLAEGAENLHAEARERFDRTLLEVALQFTRGRRAEAALKLGVGRNTVTRKLGPGRTRG